MSWRPWLRGCSSGVAGVEVELCDGDCAGTRWEETSWRGCSLAGRAGRRLMMQVLIEDGRDCNLFDFVLD